VELFHEFSRTIGQEIGQPEIFERLFQKAVEGDADCGNLLAYNYFSGEPIMRLEEGRPLFVRMPDSRFSLANFMRMHLYSAIATLRIGMDILFIDEQVRIGQLLGHGGFFKTKNVGQSMMAAALNVPVSVMETAGEGGAWGIALLAAYMLNKGSGESLETYLSKRVFTGVPGSTISPDHEDVRGFAVFMDRYKEGLIIEKTAVQSLK
jgi:sugar (pentulose or hexulose) kinase